MISRFRFLSQPRPFLSLVGAGLLLLAGCRAPSESNPKPNIVVIYADDLGYGDLGVYGAQGVETPHLDSLAQNGLRFTDAHCAAATCTPSRYALLTGRYAFRQKAAILPGDAPALIRPGTPTVASMLQQAGYATAAIGKWHLGLGNGDLDWNDSIQPGPLEIGFDYCYLIPATGDRVPSVYVENHEVVDLDPADPIRVSYDEPIGDDPTGLSHPELLRMPADTQHSNTIVNGISRIGYMSGGEAARWKDENFPYLLSEKAEAFIEEHRAQPFFLYFAFHDIHVPRVVAPQFQGASEMGPRGDAIAQLDWVCGQIFQALAERGLADNTLILVSSDNGPVLDDGYGDQAVELLGDHDPAGGLRGSKYSVYEAGTRMPTLAHWPGQIEPGVSDALLSQVDWYASLAALVGQPLDSAEAPDSHNTLDAWLGRSEQGRAALIEEAFVLGLREGKWKYIPPKNQIEPAWFATKDAESGFAFMPQLYDLSQDPAEQHNVAEQHPEVVARLHKKLEAMQAAGGTRPGWGEAPDHP